MNTLHDVESRMDYIQKLFMKVQDYMNDNPSIEGLLVFLDSEPPEFRSVAYESASMSIAKTGLLSGGVLTEWFSFYDIAKAKHPFHTTIGLGWAFGKTEIKPYELSDSQMGSSIFDGLGYYYGLFRGRRTIKNRQVPDFITADQMPGFDQGLGRRLWYHCKGNADDLSLLIQTFPSFRHADLWRGVGIACGYVGGSDIKKLEMILTLCGTFKNQFSTGISMAVWSRYLAGAITSDIDFACRIICDKSVTDIVESKTLLKN